MMLDMDQSADQAALSRLGRVITHAVELINRRPKEERMKFAAVFYKAKAEAKAFIPASKATVFRSGLEINA